MAFPRTAAPRICCRTLKQSSLSVGFHPQNECSGTCRKGERAPRSLHNSSTQESTKNTFLVKSEIQNVPREPGSTQAHESCPEARRPEGPVHLTGRGGVPPGSPQTSASTATSSARSGSPSPCYEDDTKVQLPKGAGQGAGWVGTGTPGRPFPARVPTSPHAAGACSVWGQPRAPPA